MTQHINELSDEQLIERVTREFLGWQGVDENKVEVEVGRYGPGKVVYWRTAGDDFVGVNEWNPVTSIDDAFRVLSRVTRRVHLEKHGPKTVYIQTKDWEWRCGIADEQLTQFRYGMDSELPGRAICRAVLLAMGSVSRL